MLAWAQRPAARHAASLRCPQDTPWPVSTNAATTTTATATAITNQNLNMRGSYPAAQARGH